MGAERFDDDAIALCRKSCNMVAIWGARANITQALFEWWISFNINFLVVSVHFDEFELCDTT